MAKLGTFINESYEEMRHRVTWPTGRELQTNTVLVLVASLIFALVIGAMDLVFKNLVQVIYGAAAQ